MPSISKIQDPPIKDEIAVGFLGGFNDFQDETLIKESELTDAKNIILDVDGLSPRPGTDSYGTSSGDSVVGLFGYYQADGTRELLRYATGLNDKLQKLVSSTWTDIGSQTYDSVARMNFVQARNLVFLFNGIDPLSYYDGSTITVYSALTTPENLAITPTGTPGTTTYSYRISAFNNAGETLACTSVNTSTGNATLNATNYNALAWDAVSGATGYNIWGRYATGLGETWMATVYTNSYVDKGQDTPSLTILPPEGNTTEGIICSMAVFGISRIFASGDPDNPSRLYFSGIGDRITDFSWSAIGGGYIDIYKDDGSSIRGIIPFQGGIIVFKDNAIYKFSFADDGTQLLEEITRAFGGISFRSIKHVENDIIFAAKKDGRLAFYSLGNQENYAGSILRTNELSVKVENSLRNVDVASLENSAAFYFNNIYGCAVTKSGSTKNDRIWCLDTRFGAWVYWEGVNCNVFSTFINSAGDENLYFGDEDDGDVVEMFKTSKNDRGVAISVKWDTKAFNQKTPHRYKDYYNPVVQFKDVNTSGAISGDVIVNGAIVAANFTVNTVNTGGTGVGYELVGQLLPGAGTGGTPSSLYSSDQIVELDTNQNSRSIKYSFRSNTINADYKFLSVTHQYSILGEQNLPSTSRTYTT